MSKYRVFLLAMILVVFSVLLYQVIPAGSQSSFDYIIYLPIVMKMYTGPYRDDRYGFSLSYPSELYLDMSIDKYDLENPNEINRRIVIGFGDTYSAIHINVWDNDFGYSLNEWFSQFELPLHIEDKMTIDYDARLDGAPAIYLYEEASQGFFEDRAFITSIDNYILMIEYYVNDSGALMDAFQSITEAIDFPSSDGLSTRVDTNFYRSPASINVTTCCSWSDPNPNLYQCLNGNCVWWAKYKRPDVSNNWRSAYMWRDNARREGFAVGYTACDEAIAVFAKGIQGADANYGHVAYVTDVYEDGSFNTSNMNWDGDCSTNNGVFSWVFTESGDENVTFIYKDGTNCGNTLNRADRIVAGDFDEDGFEDDVMYVGKCSSDGHICWRTHLSDGEKFIVSDFGSQIWGAVSYETIIPVVGDFDNDGFIDDVTYVGKCGGDGHICWRTHLSNGSSFSVSEFGTQIWGAASYESIIPITGDFDNDGFIDDVTYVGKCGNDGHICWRTHLSNGSSFSVSEFGAQIWGAASYGSIVPTAGDFDNDDFIDDIAYVGKCGSDSHICWRTHLSDGSSFSVSEFGAQIWGVASYDTIIPVTGNFDDDSFMDDITYVGKCGDDGHVCWRTHISNGDSFTVSDFGTRIWGTVSKDLIQPVSGDFDNDSFHDDLTYVGKCNTGSVCWRTHLSDGNQFSVISFGSQIWGLTK